MTSAGFQRAVVLILAAAVVAMNLLLWNHDPWSWGVLGVADLFLGLLLLSGWRTVAARDRR